MSGPFEIATKFLLRLLLPGAVLAAAFAPLILALRTKLGIEVEPLALLTVATFSFGWFLILLDMPIYMAFEGRRYWPVWLRSIGLASERRRLAHYLRRAEIAKESGDEPQRLEFRLQASQFPTTKEGAYVARYPTRLGNILAGFEQYPDKKYGLDGVFFWYRIWVSIDKDLREDLDNAQALVDGALYAVVSFLISAVACAAYAAIIHWNVSVIAEFGKADANLFIILSGLCLFISVILYRACVHAQTQYGELFKSLFDQHRNLLDFNPLLNDLEKAHIDLSMADKPERERNRAAWRFLRWHRYRPDGSKKNEIVENW